MRNKSDKNLFKKKFKQLSNSNLFLRGISSSTNKTNNYLSHKDSTKTKYSNQKLQLNILNKSNIKSTTQSVRPFKLFHTENKLNNLKNSSPKIKLKTSIIKSYNPNIKNKKPNISLLKTDYFKKNSFIKLKKFETPENKQKTPSDTLSKSSDKSSSIFLTSNQNNNNLNYNINNNQKYRKIHFKGSSHNIVDNFGNLVDPLIIPEEDKIFDELKKIDSLTERFNKKNKNNPIFKSIMDIKDDLKEKENKEDEKDKDKNDKIIKRNKNLLSHFNKTFYDHNHFKLKYDEKDLLEALYMTSEDFFNKLNKIKKGKKNKELPDYQKELLDLVKPVVSIYGFERLKNNFDNLKRRNKIVKTWNIECLKKIEDNEENIINDINYLYNKYLTSNKIKSNYFSKYNPKNFKLELPEIEFKRVLKIEDEEDIQLREYLKKKENIKDKNLQKSVQKSVQKSIQKSVMSYSPSRNKKIISSSLFRSVHKFSHIDSNENIKI